MYIYYRYKKPDVLYNSQIDGQVKISDVQSKGSLTIFLWNVLAKLNGGGIENMKYVRMELLSVVHGW